MQTMIRGPPLTVLFSGRMEGRLRAVPMVETLCHPLILVM